MKKLLCALIALTNVGMYAADAEGVLVQTILKQSPSAQKASARVFGDEWLETFKYSNRGHAISTQYGKKYVLEEIVSYVKDSKNETHPIMRRFFYANNESTRIASHVVCGKEHGTIDGIYPAKKIPDSVKKRRAERDFELKILIAKVEAALKR